MGFRICGLGVALSFLAMPFGTTQVAAGPDDTTKYLMAETVSMLDWGIMQITNFRLNDGNSPAGYAEYSFEDDRIYIRSFATSDEALDATGFQSICKQWMDAVRISAFVLPTTGLPMTEEYSYFASLFRHNGFLRGEGEDQTERLKALDKKFHLVYSIRKTDYTERYRCNAPLLGTGFASESFEKP